MYGRKATPNLINPIGYAAPDDWRPYQPAAAAGSMQRHEDMVLSLLGLSLAAEQKTTTGAEKIAGLWDAHAVGTSAAFF